MTPPPPIAMIMAGGKGHRMHPFTEAMPKALLPVGNTILLDILASQLHQAGCRDLVISLGRLAPVIRAYCGGRTLPLPVRFVEETSPLGTAGALALLDAAPHGVLVINCDVLTDARFADLIARHHARAADITVLGVVHTRRLQFGVLESNPDGRLTGWHEGLEHRYTGAAGVYMIGPRALALISDGERLDMPELVHRVMESRGLVQVHTHEGAWYDLGTPPIYDEGVAAFTASPERFGVPRHA
ncbi:MAG TPA: sugar phosphate nucleotidyltransferase [Phycisphaerales bacterium]|nr:sugar phosphate nucleotidyltransferase [Phycisphaerales bacterium]